MPSLYQHVDVSTAPEEIDRLVRAVHHACRRGIDARGYVARRRGDGRAMTHEVTVRVLKAQGLQLAPLPEPAW